jgi:hypothetical protein
MFPSNWTSSGVRVQDCSWKLLFCFYAVMLIKYLSYLLDYHTVVSFVARRWLWYAILYSIKQRHQHIKKHTPDQQHVCITKPTTARWSKKTKIFYKHFILFVKCKIQQHNNWAADSIWFWRWCITYRITLSIVWILNNKKNMTFRPVIEVGSS